MSHIFVKILPINYHGKILKGYIVSRREKKLSLQFMTKQVTKMRIYNNLVSAFLTPFPRINV